MCRLESPRIDPEMVVGGRIPVQKYRDAGRNERPPLLRRKLPFSIMSRPAMRLAGALGAAVLFTLIIHRVANRTVLALTGDADFASLVIIPAGAALIKLCFIIYFDSISSQLAEKLTGMESPRTQTEYDDSLSMKMYLFQIVNLGTSIFHAMYVNGRISESSGGYDTTLHKDRQGAGLADHRFWGFLIQLAVILIGKQVVPVLSEIWSPLVQKVWHSLRRFEANHVPRNLRHDPEASHQLDSVKKETTSLSVSKEEWKTAPPKRDERRHQ